MTEQKILERFMALKLTQPNVRWRIRRGAHGLPGWVFSCFARLPSSLPGWVFSCFARLPSSSPGDGAAALKAVCELADELGLVLSLWTEPPRLYAYYEAFGFVDTKRQMYWGPTYQVFVRQPVRKEAECLATAIA